LSKNTKPAKETVICAPLNHKQKAWRKRRK